MVLGRRRADAPAVVVLAEDTTASDFSGPNTLVLGPIGNGAGQGDACHHPRAVAPRTRAISDLVDQAVARLDRSARGPRYAATGSRPHRPDPLLRATLDESHRGPHSPATGSREAPECQPLRWRRRGG